MPGLNEPRVAEAAGGAAARARARRRAARRLAGRSAQRRRARGRRAGRARARRRAARRTRAHRARRARTRARPRLRSASLLLAPLRSHLLLANHPVERLEGVLAVPTTVNAALVNWWFDAGEGRDERSGNECAGLHGERRSCMSSGCLGLLWKCE